MQTSQRCDKRATTLTTFFLTSDGGAALWKYLVSFLRTTPKVSRYLFPGRWRSCFWLLVAFVLGVLHRQRAAPERSGDPSEFNLSSDQAQRYIQRNSTMKELVHCRKSPDGGKRYSAIRGRNDKTEVLDSLSRCSWIPTGLPPASKTLRRFLESLSRFGALRDNSPRWPTEIRVFLIGSENSAWPTLACAMCHRT